MKTAQVRSRLNVRTLAQAGAIASAIIASACCWLPLVLIAVGVSGGALAAKFEAWRPVLLPVTFALLALAFYSTYRKPERAAGAGHAQNGDTCCATAVEQSEPCCPPGESRRLTIRGLNKMILWIVTAVVLAFALFPNYVGYLLGSRTERNRDTVTAAALGEQVTWTLGIDGMTCQGCAASIQATLSELPGVAIASVSYEQRIAAVSAGVSVNRNSVRPCRKPVTRSPPRRWNLQTQ